MPVGAYRAQIEKDEGRRRAKSAFGKLCQGMMSPTASSSRKAMRHARRILLVPLLSECSAWAIDFRSCGWPRATLGGYIAPRGALLDIEKGLGHIRLYRRVLLKGIGQALVRKCLKGCRIVC